MDPRRVLRLVPLLLAFMLTLASSVFAADPYTFTTFDPPGSNFTIAFGINNAGQIVGLFDTGAGPTHAFLFSGEHYTTLDHPGSEITLANGINNAGQIVGKFDDARGLHGFLFSGGHFTTLDPPGSINAWAHGINDTGQIVGEFDDASEVRHGFLFSGEHYTTLDPPGSQSTIAWGINNAGQIVGEFEDGDGAGHGFLFSGGHYTTLDRPASDFDTSGASWGINNAGQIVSSFSDDDTGLHGFLFSEGRFTSINLPDGTYTRADGINDTGQIVGDFGDATGVHGFLATSSRGFIPNNPLLPSSTLSDVFTFTNPAPGLWFDPPSVDGFTYTLMGGATFTEVGAPPVSFGFGAVKVVVGGVIVNILNPGEDFFFSLPVTTFSLEGISPLVDAGNPTAFPTFLDFTGTATTLTMTALATPAATVPEPGTWLLFATGLVGLLGYGWRRRQHAV